MQFHPSAENRSAIAFPKPDVAPVIKVSASRKESEWIFSVSDNGQGFEQQYAERIFGLFQRLNNRDVEGTGMGLSISRKIVDRHGGQIWAESKIGEGSTFYFSLPVTLEISRVPAEAPETTSFPQRL